uniref:Si:ch73-288o11.4 n=1 Tax=Myripristis murdjan TaxID=586833 RepID=A0A667YFM2_9TELE
TQLLYLLYILYYSFMSAGCVDEDGKEHPFGSQWVKNCVQCYCTGRGMACCTISISFPEPCEMLVDKKTCSFRLVLKSDKTKKCIPA